MSYPMDLDDYNALSLEVEILRRSSAVQNGLCPYCENSAATHTCKYEGASIAMYWSPTMKFLGDLLVELDRARDKFPTNAHLTVALLEEAGELAKSQLQRMPEYVYREAVQTATTAMRIALEGDADLANVTDEEAKS